MKEQSTARPHFPTQEDVHLHRGVTSARVKVAYAEPRAHSQQYTLHTHLFVRSVSLFECTGPEGYRVSVSELPVGHFELDVVC